MDQNGEAAFVGATFLGNAVDAAAIRNEGGALSLSSGVRFRMRDSELRNNSANGNRPFGGAVHSSAVYVVLLNTSLLWNRLVVSTDEGYGGAIRMDGGTLRLEGCRVHDNVAESLPGSVAAWGGAVYTELTTGPVAEAEGSTVRPITLPHLHQD
jgi:hypothetical protein